MFSYTILIVELDDWRSAMVAKQGEIGGFSGATFAERQYDSREDSHRADASEGDEHDLPGL